MKKSFIYFLTLLVSCSSDAGRYRKIVDAELASGRRVDRVIFDIHFGMAKKDFYDYCWKMHQLDSFDDGGNVTSVLYKIKTQLRYPASMHFFPEFRKDSIFKVWAQVNYDGWAPWNRQMIADSLLVDMVRLYSEWYPGNPFITLTDKKRGTIYVKVDGNRRIILGRKDDGHVNVDYTDLLVENNNKD